MAMTEAARQELYEALKEHIGVDPADTLMAAMPPVGWADVATKRDLDVLRNEVRLELEARTQSLRADITDKLTETQRNLFFGFFAAHVASAALIINVLG